MHIHASKIYTRVYTCTRMCFVLSSSLPTPPSPHLPIIRSGVDVGPTHTVGVRKSAYNKAAESLGVQFWVHRRNGGALILEGLIESLHFFSHIVLLQTQNPKPQSHINNVKLDGKTTFRFVQKHTTCPHSVHPIARSLIDSTTSTHSLPYKP